MASEGIKLYFPVMGIQVLQFFIGGRSIVALGYEGESHNTAALITYWGMV
jgi:hypothetical protein